MDSESLDAGEKEHFKEILNGVVDWEKKKSDYKSREEKDDALSEDVSKYAVAINELSGYLKKHHEKNVIILLDEYDVPLENAYYTGFYDRMISFIHSLFESALKTNEALERAVITGACE